MSTVSHAGPRGPFVPVAARGPSAALALALLAWGCALLTWGCAPGSVRVREITATRVVARPGSSWQPDASSAARFGLRLPGPAVQAAAPSFAWETPAGWVELPSSPLRQANFLAAGDERAQCYLTILAGDGGGLGPNVDRWRAQMSLPPLDPAALDALPRAEFFGGDAALVDLEGTWTDMAGESGSDYRLLGLLRFDPGAAKFLKMVGPASVVEREVAAFLALARSFRERGAPAADAAATASVADARGSTGLAWTAPEGWRRAAERPMREVSFTVDPDGLTECYVSVLGGDGGGLFANVERWLRQMGQPPLSAEQLAALERFPMLGDEALLVEARGPFEGVDGERVEDASLLGAACLHAGRAVFVKMVGPRASVESQRAAFREFCSSLRLDE